MKCDERPWIDPELQARFRAMHPRRALEAENRLLLASALAVYQAAGARREAAEDRLAAALEATKEAAATEDEWRCIVHGLTLRVARVIDGTPPDEESIT